MYHVYVSTCTKKQNYLGIAIVASNEKPQMRYKMRRVNRRPVLSRSTMTKIMAGNSMALPTEKYTKSEAPSLLLFKVKP